MIVITIEMDVPVSKSKELMQTLKAIIGRMRNEEGCLGYDILKDVEDDRRYTLIGKWEREDMLNGHLQSAR